MNRWLYAFGLAAMMLWHQAGAASPAIRSATASTSEWRSAGAGASSSCADLVSPGAADLEDQSFAKRPAAPVHAWIERPAGREAPAQSVAGVVGDRIAGGVPAVIVSRKPIRGPPAVA